MTNEKLYRLVEKFKMGQKISAYHLRKLVALGFVTTRRLQTGKRGQPKLMYWMTQQADDFLEAYRRT